MRGARAAAAYDARRDAEWARRELQQAQFGQLARRGPIEPQAEGCTRSAARQVGCTRTACGRGRGRRVREREKGEREGEGVRTGVAAEARGRRDTRATATRQGRQGEMRVLLPLSRVRPQVVCAWRAAARTLGGCGAQARALDVLTQPVGRVAVDHGAGRKAHTALTRRAALRAALRAARRAALRARSLHTRSLNARSLHLDLCRRRRDGRIGRDVQLRLHHGRRRRRRHSSSSGGARHVE
eukprot:6267369-Prymnesium_polylepis.1